ncbi:hypothetical protein AC578_5978 [Pseudocercospora eumusae]|uniref:Uncharacterized protein n=1 Tax=Pseudocercospora eumusae TaxID=321146 RepID=A0A139HI51_9PEZI|nr:hypothetical protein AC578_5978 [Pseudocercospora eumusae]
MLSVASICSLQVSRSRSLMMLKKSRVIDGDDEHMMGLFINFFTFLLLHRLLHQYMDRMLSPPSAVSQSSDVANHDFIVLRPDPVKFVLKAEQLVLASVTSTECMSPSARHLYVPRRLHEWHHFCLRWRKPSQREES